MPGAMIRSAVVLSLLACGCTYFRPATAPMPVVLHEAPAGVADTLFVLLPGLGDGPEDYSANGFVEQIQQARPRADVIAADAHFGYYRSRTFLPRLKADVIDPVADRYEQIWFVGISLGGFGSAIFCEEFPDTVDGLILLAPFMGERDVIASVRQAGGLADWTPPTDFSGIEDDASRKFHELWAFFKSYADGGAARGLPELYIGWGTEDGLHVPISMVAAVLPPERTMAVPGGHRWTVWQPLFADLLARALAAD